MIAALFVASLLLALVLAFAGIITDRDDLLVGAMSLVVFAIGTLVGSVLG